MEEEGEIYIIWKTVVAAKTWSAGVFSLCLKRARILIGPLICKTVLWPELPIPLQLNVKLILLSKCLIYILTTFLGCSGTEPLWIIHTAKLKPQEGINIKLGRWTGKTRRTVGHLYLENQYPLITCPRFDNIKNTKSKILEICISKDGVITTCH